MNRRKKNNKKLPESGQDDFIKSTHFEFHYLFILSKTIFSAVRAIADLRDRNLTLLVSKHARYHLSKVADYMLCSYYYAIDT